MPRPLTDSWRGDQESGLSGIMLTLDLGSPNAAPRSPQFNFGDSAAQTFNFPLRDRATMTEPPPTATASGGHTAAWRDVRGTRAGLTSRLP
jgi:hypothetical protein